MGSHVSIQRFVIALAASALLCAGVLRAQQPTQRRSSPTIGTQIYLVFPFENAGASPRLDWLGEGLEELTILRLSAAGESVYSHSGRINELDRYGLPPGAKLSRATMLRIAEDLDVDYVVYGSFSSDGVKLSVQSRILRVNPPALLPVAIETGPLDSLMDLQTKLAWRSLSTNDQLRCLEQFTLCAA